MLMLTSCRLKRMLLFKASEEICNELSVPDPADRTTSSCSEQQKEAAIVKCLLLSFSLRVVHTYLFCHQGSRAILYAVFTHVLAKDTNIRFLN